MATEQTKEGLSGESTQTHESVKEKAKTGVQGLTQQATEAAHEACSQITEQGKALLHEQKGHVADQVHGVSRAIHKAAETLREENDATLAAYTDAVADNVDRVVDYIRHRDLKEIVDDVSQAARRRPELFLTGAFFGGLLLARFFKSGTTRTSPVSSTSEGDGHRYPPPAKTPTPPVAETETQGSQATSAYSSQQPGPTSAPEPVGSGSPARPR